MTNNSQRIVLHFSRREARHDQQRIPPSGAVSCVCVCTQLCESGLRYVGFLCMMCVREELFWKKYSIYSTVVYYYCIYIKLLLLCTVCTVYTALSGRSTNQRSSMGSHSHSQNSIDDCMHILCRGYCSVR